MGISKLSYGSGDNLFEISYKDDEVITTSGSNSYISNNFVANTFAAFQSKKLTKFFEAGPNNSYNDATESNCIWRKWDGWNRTDLLAGSDVPDGYYTFNSLLTDHDGRRIITELTDIQRVVWFPEVMEDTVNTRINGAAVTVKYYTINTSGNQPLCNIIDATNPLHYTAEGVPIYPWLLNPTNKTQLQVHFNRGDDLTPWGGGCSRYSGVRVYGDNNDRYYPVSTTMINYDVPTGNYQNFAFYDDTNSYLMWCSLSTDNYASASLRCYITSEDELKLYLASCGFKFVYKGRMYKPVAENNVIVGYTDDLSSQSDWDSWHTKDDHDKPITPPAPTPSGDGDDMESMTTGFASSLNGCAKYYLMSPSDMRDLITDFYTHAFAGSTMSESIISCHLCGIEPSFFLAVSDEKIKIPTVSQQNIFESEAKYSEITAVNNLLPVGHITVPRMNNDFHDFTPYTIYEIFIPYCGWCSLPDTVAGRTIWVEYHVDIRTMSGKGIVLVEGDNGGKATCAEMAMNFGVTSPFAVIEAGLARQAAVTAGIQTAVGFASGVVGAMSGHNALTVSGVGNAIQGCANGAMSSMTNYTQVQGKAGDTSDFANGRQCYLKISWSKTDEVVNNSMFGHTIGYICNEVGTLENYSGFTVCLNPHITGIDCTDEEKEEIKGLLENGVIL